MKLKPGVEIGHKKKRYVGEIPDEIFDEIYGKDNEKKKEKYQLVEPKKKKSVKNEPAGSGN